MGSALNLHRRLSTQFAADQLDQWEQERDAKFIRFLRRPEVTDPIDLLSMQKRLIQLAKPRLNSGADGGMKDEIVEAFRHASQGFSPDRVVADPDLNRVLFDECNRLGLGSDAAKLNQSLLNLRKRGALRGIRSRRTILQNQADYRFAAEIAARFLERKNECHA